MGRKLFLAVLVAGLLAMVGQAWAYSGVWIPTDNDVNEFSFDSSLGLTRTWNVYLFDWGTQSPDINNSLLILDTSNKAATITFTLSGSDWIAKSSINNSYTLNLGVTKEYGLFFYDGSSYIYDYDISLESPPGQYKLVVGSGDNQDQDTFLQNDARPVPLPGSVLLLGSGLLGLALVYRRRKKSV
jgi:hypothetical protein